MIDRLQGFLGNFRKSNRQVIISNFSFRVMGGQGSEIHTVPIVFAVLAISYDFRQVFIEFLEMRKFF